MEFVFGQPTVEALLRQYVYVVPRFQRSYEWTEVEWDDLWADVLAVHGQRQAHFMGAIVVSKSFNDDAVPAFPANPPSVRFVIDGQQRLVTISILLARLHRRLEALGLVGADVQNELIRWIMLRDPLLPQQTSSPRVILNDEQARDTFNSIVDPMPTPPKINKKVGRPPASLARMRKAAEFFDEKISTYVAAGPTEDALTQLRDLVLAIGRKMQFVDIEVDSEADAYTIFESLNARGIDLTAADLVKNLLLGRAKRLGDQLDALGIVHKVSDAVEQEWETTVDLIRTGFSERLPAFLRHYWIAEHEFIREDRLYKAISSFVRQQTAGPTPRSATESAKALTTFASAVATSAGNYVWLWSGEHEAPYEPHPSIDRIRLRLNGIRAFNAVQVLPVLLAALNRRPALQEFEQLCVSAEVAVVRRSLADQPGNRVERESGELCELLRADNASPTAIGKVRERLRRLAAEGQEPDPFQYKSVSAEKSKHILLSLENHLRQSQRKEATLLDPNKVDIEHVLPQSPQEKAWPINDWGDIERQKSLLNRLGNFALLSKNANRAVGNAPFSCGNEPGTVRCCKRHTYLNSELLLTREIADSDTWSPAQIEARQKRLAVLARYVWPYSAP